MGKEVSEPDEDIDLQQKLPEAVSVFAQPAAFVNWMNVLAFGDDTVRVTFGESITEEMCAPRGAFRMTLGKAHELSQVLSNMVAAALQQREIQAEARRKLN